MKRLRINIAFLGLLGFSLVSTNFIEANADTYSMVVNADATDIPPTGIDAEYTGQKVIGCTLKKSDFVVRYLYDGENGQQEKGRRLAENEFSINPTSLVSTDNVIHIQTDPTATGVLQTDVNITTSEQQEPKPNDPGNGEPNKTDADGGGNSPSNSGGSSSSGNSGSSESLGNSGGIDSPEKDVGDVLSGQEDAVSATNSATAKTGDALWGMMLIYVAIFVLSLITTLASLKQLRNSEKQ